MVHDQQWTSMGSSEMLSRVVLPPPKMPCFSSPPVLLPHHLLQSFHNKPHLCLFQAIDELPPELPYHRPSSLPPFSSHRPKMLAREVSSLIIFIFLLQDAAMIFFQPYRHHQCHHHLCSLDPPLNLAILPEIPHLWFTVIAILHHHHQSYSSSLLSSSPAPSSPPLMMTVALRATWWSWEWSKVQPNYSKAF